MLLRVIFIYYYFFYFCNPKQAKPPAYFILIFAVSVSLPSYKLFSPSLLSTTAVPSGEIAIGLVEDVPHVVAVLHGGLADWSNDDVIQDQVTAREHRVGRRQTSLGRKGGVRHDEVEKKGHKL